MRAAVIVTTLCLSAVGLSAAADDDASGRKQTSIPAQRLVLALQVLAKDWNLQVVYRSEVVGEIKSQGASGELTIAEVLTQLLRGTGLTYTQLDDKAITIVPISLPKGETIGRAAELPSSGTNSAGALLAAVGEGASPIHLVQDSLPDSAGDAESDEKKKKKSQRKNEAVEEMIVEKSKIKPFSDANADLPRTINDPQAYYIFDSKEIERSGALTVEDFLRQRLTMDTTYESNSDIVTTRDWANFNGVNASRMIPGSTISSFNLRGLGSGKTLILVNGRRMAGVSYPSVTSGTVTEMQPDLNGISLSAIDRIEVLAGSASAIYGGGSIGGVINVVLKRSFQGGNLQVSYDTPSQSSAYTSKINATYGLSFEGGKSQLMASAYYSTAEPMLVGDRVKFMESGLAYLAKYHGGLNARTISQGQPSMGPTGTYVWWAGVGGVPVPLTLKDGTVVAPAPTLDGTGAYFGGAYFGLAYIKPGTTSATPMAQRWAASGPEFFTPSQGYGPWGVKQPLGSVADVKSFNLSLTRKMTSWLEAFTDVQLNENDAKTAYVPTIEVVLKDWGLSADDIPANPFASNVGIAKFGTTPAIAVPIETSSLVRNVTMGFKGRFSNGWAGELSYTKSQNKFNQNYQPPDTGFIANRAGEGLIDLLVDPFATNMDLSQYDLGQPITTRSNSDQMILRMAGPVFHLPWGDPTLSMGLDRQKSSVPSAVRQERYFADDTNSSSPLLSFDSRLNDRTYFGRSTTNDSLYVEGLIPLVTEKNAVPLMHAFDVQLAQRMSRSVAQTGTDSMYVQYAANGSINYFFYTPTPPDSPDGFFGGTPIFRTARYSSRDKTIALKYEPIAGVMLRASLGSAFLPATYMQLIPDQKLTPNGATVFNDPVTQLPPYRVNSISGGNPNLLPQRSESRHIGLVYEPSGHFLRGLRVNFEYYQIGQFDFISTPNIAELLTLPELAYRVTRDPSTGRVTQVNLSLTNIAEHSTAGMDAVFNYRKLTRWGDWSFSLSGTKVLFERRQFRATSPMIDYAGFVGDGGPLRYKANGSLAWARNHVTLGWMTNWIGNYRLGGTPGSPSGFQNYSNSPWVIQGSYSIPPQMFHNVFAGYDFGKDAKIKIMSGLGIQLNIQNVFNTAPRFDATHPPFYISPMGSFRLRAYALSVKKNF